MSQEKVCKVKISCPKGYVRKTLITMAKDCNISIKRTPPFKNNKTMGELCRDFKEKHGIDETICDQNETTETFGMTVERMICDICNIPTIINESRISKKLLADEKLKNVIEIALTKLPKIIRHVGSENNSEDFIMKDGTKLSVKTNQSGAKVCPQKIGQTTLKKFVDHFTLNSTIEKSNITTKYVKSYIINHKAKIISEYFKYNFVCDYILWIIIKKDEYEAIIVNRSEILKHIMDPTKYIFTRDEMTWNESTTVKYNTKTIGEFQIHTNRDSIKFRFDMKNLLNILRDDPSVFVVSNDTVLRSKTKTEPTPDMKPIYTVGRTLKSNGGENKTHATYHKR